MKKLNNQGFAHAALLALVVVVAAVIGFTGYTVLKHNKSNAGGTSSVGASTCGGGYVAEGSLAGLSKTGTLTPYMGEIKVYVNKSTKTICALNVSTGVSAGVAKPMSIKMGIHKASNGAVVAQSGQDSGSFKSYAGPVYVSYASAALNYNYYLSFNGGTTYLQYKGVNYIPSGNSALEYLVNFK